MQLVGAAGQIARHPFYDASGTIAAGGTAQLVLPLRQSCSLLKLQNLSNGPLYFEFGSARAHATLTGGKITAITVDNGGFGFKIPPLVEFLGGGDNGTGSAFLGGNIAGYPAPVYPGRPAKATAKLTGGVVSSIQIDDPGAGYVIAPYIHIYNSPLDPYGCATPSATSGMLLASQSPPYFLDRTCCTTDPIAVFGATTGQAFLAKWMI